ncbi:MAG: aminopeptidase [Bryobacteraceae bacterium]|nr:MAG: aminopeptidase [Bryobacteraceae bacterium]
MRVLVACVAAAALLGAQERVDLETIGKIRGEAEQRSQVMKHLQVLTDRYGPRLTGSPNYEAAARWAMKRLAEWGLRNARLEPWDFGHEGWSNERATGHLASPVRDALVFEVMAWTPSTTGTARGDAVLLVPPSSPTQGELEAWLKENAGRVRGRIVLLGKPRDLPVSFTAPSKRLDEEAVKRRLEARMGPPRPAAPKAEPGRLTPQQVNAALDAWLVANGALVKVLDAGMPHGMIRAFQNRTYDVTKSVPAVYLRNEDYGRAARLIEIGEKVEMEFEIVNRTHPGRTTWNVLADIPGAEKPEEVVLIGAHLDSWHAATGATDNAAGVAVMMEAVRILTVLGLRPARTIRIALWSAEEQGLLGSKHHVQANYGTFESPKPGFARLCAYLNLDSGTGRIRGASVFGPEEAAAVVAAVLAPFRDQGVAGAAASSSRREGGTDSTSFSSAGLPAIGFFQDPIEYFQQTWHTNLDTYERAVPDDLKQASAVVAAVAWHLAARDEMLPRFSADTMPAPAVTAPPVTQ